MSLWPHLMPTYKAPEVSFIRGEGCYLFDESGRAYLDFFSGVAVTLLGHCHPQVVEAVERQLRLLWHPSNHFGHPLREEVAQALDEIVRLSGGASGKVFFCNSGAEAVECAIKLARKATGRKGLVGFTGGFHGRTYGALSVTGQEDKKAPFAPLVGEVYIAGYGSLQEAEQLVTDQTAAVVVEPIEGEGGVIVPPKGYLSALERICRDRGALLIVDEVQTGLGRTGWWCAFEAEGLKPDIVCFAKALGNGFPVGACWARSEVADCFSPGDHGSTFGGNPLAMAAANATLSVLKEINAPFLARELGEMLWEGLKDLPGTSEVRGAGLLLGVELLKPVAVEVQRICLEKGLVVNAVRPSSLRLAPPLLLGEDDIEKGLKILGAALREVGVEASA